MSNEFKLLLIESFGQIDQSRDALVTDDKGKSISKNGSAGACRLTNHKTTFGHNIAMLSIPIRSQQHSVSIASRKLELQEIEKVWAHIHMCLQKNCQFNCVSFILSQTLFAVCKYLKPAGSSSSDEVHYFINPT
jgi:hypothetical protein